MVTIIHGGHREGICFDAAKKLKELLIEKGTIVKFYSLKDQHFEYCCGYQQCQDTGKCIHDDLITREIIPSIAKSDALLVFTPTYFNMPPAILKNFIDRCNLLLTIEDRKQLKFGAWVSGQTTLKEKSIEACFDCLASIADIFGYDLLKNGKLIHANTNLSQITISEDDLKKLQEFAKEL